MRFVWMLLVLGGVACGQQPVEDFIPETVLEYANGLNNAKAERRPLLVFITQRSCQPCKPARKLLDEMRLDGRLGKCLIAIADATTPEGRAIMVGKKFTPQIVILDFRQQLADGSIEKHGIEKVDEPTIKKLIDKIFKKE